MRSLTPAVLILATALGTGACAPTHTTYRGPGCRIDLYSLPDLQGSGIPVVKDTAELAEVWRRISSAKVIYGTWRLFAEAGYKDFMGDYRAPADVLQLKPAGHLGSLQCIMPEPAPLLYQPMSGY
jgi:hypothetical protein